MGFKFGFDLFNLKAWTASAIESDLNHLI